MHSRLYYSNRKKSHDIKRARPDRTRFDGLGSARLVKRARIRAKVLARFVKRAGSTRLVKINESNSGSVLGLI